MGFLDQVTEGMVRSDADGRRIFCQGVIFSKKRCVYVDAQQERDLRRTYGLMFLVPILAMVLTDSLASLWVRLVAIVPVWVLVVHVVLRRKMDMLPTAPAGARRSQRELALSGARALGPFLLWGELVFFTALTVIALSPLVPNNEVGWENYGAVIVGVGGAAYVLYQLYLLRKSRE